MIWIWNPGSARPAKLPPPDPNAGAVVSLSRAPDGALAAAYEDGALALWSNPQAAETPVVLRNTEARRLAWLGNGTGVAAITGKGEIILVDWDGSFTRIPSFQNGIWADGVVAIGSNDLIVSHVRGTLARWRSREAGWVPVASESMVGDRLSALSLSVHPGGRWLVATRGDDRLKIYDLFGQVEPVSLNLLRPDTKTVAFSPDGSVLAALGSEGRMYLWNFDSETGNAVLRATASDLPLPADYGTARGEVRPVSWIDWVDARRLAVATPFGEILLLAVDEAGWVSGAEAVLPTRP